MTKRLSLARFGAILSYGVAALVNFRAFQNRLVECRMSGAVGALLAAGTGLCIWLFPWGDGLERWSYDLLFLSKRVQAPPEAVIVLLDDMSYSQLGQNAGSRGTGDCMRSCSSTSRPPAEPWSSTFCLMKPERTR